MNNETIMMSATILSQVELDLGTTDEQPIELTEIGREFFIERVIITSPTITPVKAIGAQIHDNPEKMGNLLFTSIDHVAQYDYLNSLFHETNYCCLNIPTDGFPVMNNNHIVKTNRLYFSLLTPHKGLKATMYVLGYILK